MTYWAARELSLKYQLQLRIDTPLSKSRMTVTFRMLIDGMKQDIL